MESPVFVGGVFVEEKSLAKPLNLIQSNEILLKTHKFADIVFVVVPTKEDEEVQRFPAHRIICSTRSRVFQNMFFGPDSVSIPSGEELLEVEIGDGVSAEAFNIVLRYIYCDDLTQVTEINVMSILYCAKKYELEGLRVECVRKAKEMAKRDTKMCVLTFLKDSQVLEETELTEVCLQLISLNSRELLQQNHAEFIYLTQAAVIAICKQDVLAISEYDLFLLVSDWAAAEADREGLDVSSTASMRYVLLNVLPHIRFPTMAHDKLAIEVRNSGLLTPEELTDLFAHCLSRGRSETKYSSKARVMPTPQMVSRSASPTRKSSSPPLSSTSPGAPLTPNHHSTNHHGSTGSGSMHKSSSGSSGSGSGSGSGSLSNKGTLTRHASKTIAAAQKTLSAGGSGSRNGSRKNSDGSLEGDSMPDGMAAKKLLMLQIDTYGTNVTNNKIGTGTMLPPRHAHDKNVPESPMRSRARVGRA